jgi:hypothetical protein
LTEKRKEIGILRDRLASGVEKLESTEIEVNQLKASLTEKEPQLIKTQADVNEMIQTLKVESDKAEEKKQSVEKSKADVAIKKGLYYNLTSMSSSLRSMMSACH